MEKTYLVDQLVVATKGQRFFNYIIDYVVILVITFVAITGLYLIADFLSWWNILEYLEKIETLNRLEEYLFYILIAVPYYYLMEVLTQKSIGKWITNTLVVDIAGNKPSPTDLIKRSFLRVIPFDGISFLGHNARGWHDRYSDTYVVDKKKMESAKENFYALEALGNDPDI